ncbi:uracil-DNA glycosylase family protein [Pantoea sp. S62]|uniref:uracil-DNA glycosylase family protein n=1 Tax=Pantoea sp. S62 TaxID=2769342 RepID=UPI0019131523|nr:uracil-DNA glycosylase family protein [Pantoea sp. S62]MBK5017176.1 uracil-DNA glycosylase [Pantoea sp. S62]
MKTAGTLLDEAVMTQRLAGTGAEHVAPLNAWVSGLRAAGTELPWFDPADGGVRAALLVLLQSPALSSPSPRFVSRDNPGPAQQNLGRFLAEADIARGQSVLWNVVPWVSGGGRSTPSAADVKAGCDLLVPLLSLLPALQVVVLAGAVAARAEPLVRQARPGVQVLVMPHPSPLALCAGPSVTEKIRTVLRQAQIMLTGKSGS